MTVSILLLCWLISTWLQLFSSEHKNYCCFYCCLCFKIVQAGKCFLSVWQLIQLFITPRKGHRNIFPLFSFSLSLYFSLFLSFCLSLLLSLLSLSLSFFFFFFSSFLSSLRNNWGDYCQNFWSKEVDLLLFVQGFLMQEANTKDMKTYGYLIDYLKSLCKSVLTQQYLVDKSICKLMTLIGKYLFPFSCSWPVSFSLKACFTTAVTINNKLHLISVKIWL